jgi:hypothetical protein
MTTGEVRGSEWGECGVLTDAVAILRAYQETCNRFDVEASVALFAEDGVIDDRGVAVRGQEAIRATHEYDRAVNARITLDDFRVTADTIRGRFVYTKELDRILRLDGLHQVARFIVRDGRIHAFTILGPDEAELQRHLRRKAPFFDWAKRHHPETYARSRSFDRDGGEALRQLGEAWIHAGRPTMDWTSSAGL